MSFHGNKDCVPILECVACGSSDLKSVLDLGKQPLANSFKLNQNDVQAEYPLAINHCEHCYHVQLTHSVNPKLMFEDYLYVSGTSKTMHQHFEDFVSVVEMFHHKAMTVLDVGCNDGTQLDYFKKFGFQTFGVDPAKNLHEETNKRHRVYCGWFNDDYAKSAHRKFDVITAQNVFAHGPEPIEFLKIAKQVLADDGLLFIQTSQATMIQNGEFDTIYHEHVSFFNTCSMRELCLRVGLHLQDVIYMPIHGTSYVFVIGKNPAKSDNVGFNIEAERKDGLFDDATYVDYAAGAHKIINDLKEMLHDTQRPVIGYGAPAKGMTLLNYGKINLDFIIDDSPLKQNRFTPGMSIPIYSSDHLDRIYENALFVPLAWNFYNEITDKIKTKRPNHDDLFCRYFPEVRIEHR